MRRGGLLLTLTLTLSQRERGNDCNSTAAITTKPPPPNQGAVPPRCRAAKKDTAQSFSRGLLCLRRFWLNRESQDRPVLAPSRSESG